MTAISELPAEPIAAAGRGLSIDRRSVAAAREFAVRYLTGEAKLDGDHVDDVVLVVSELVTNAIKYGGGGRNIHLEIGVWSKWTLITVDDRSREVRQAAPAVDGDEDLRESGRGLEIVEALTERWWWHPRSFSKTANAVILRPGVKPTEADNIILDRLEMDG